MRNSSRACSIRMLRLPRMTKTVQRWVRSDGTHRAYTAIVGARDVVEITDTRMKEPASWHCVLR